MSSGLVATMALPAQAVSGAESGPQTASIPAVPGGGSAFFASPEGGLLSLPTGLALEDGTVSAPAAAPLDFDQSDFVAVPGPGGLTVQPKAPVDLGLPGARTGSTTRGDAGLKLEDGPSAGTTTTKAPATRREARRNSSTSASPSPSATQASVSTTVDASSLGSSAIAIASRYLGVKYRFGGDDPSGFDCSGLIQYVYAQLGHKLPRTAAEQADAVRHIPRSQARPGDLVLFPGRGHIALYMGKDMMLDAPHSGTVVQIRKIYSANVSFGRVG